MTYCTLDDVKLEMKGDAAKLTASDTTWLTRALRVASDQLAKLASGAGYGLEPFYKALGITPSGSNVSTANKILRLPEPLLEADTIVSGGTTLTLDTNVYYEPAWRYPIDALRIGSCVDMHWWPCDADCGDSITITGFWGYRRAYDSEGFLQVDALAANLTASAVSMTVGDADGPDYYGLTPRFSVGGLYRIEDEIVEVTAVDTTTQAITILRGRRGTTAAAHASGTAVKFWYIEPEIRHVAARHVALMYARRGAYQQVVTEFGSVSYPSDLLGEARAAIQRLMYA